MEEIDLLTEWKNRLGLSDWFFVLMDHCSPSELMEDADGTVEYVETTKCALIRIVDEEQRNDSIRPFDYEQVLVHQLLHCKFALLMGGNDWDRGLQARYLHTLVDDMARALVSAKRGN